MTDMMSGMMGEAVDAAFGATMDVHLQPLTVRIADLEAQVLALNTTIAGFVQMLNVAIANNGKVAKLFGGA